MAEVDEDLREPGADAARRAGLLERDAELTRLDQAVVRASAGDGGVVLCAGAAGLGKTALLLAAARDLAPAAGLSASWATASELDRDAPFGVVRQLLEPRLTSAAPQQRAAWLSGYAALSEPVFAGGAPDAQPAAEDPGHAVLHALYWLVAAIAEDGALLLAVDDVQWADRASLRFLEFLGRRLEGLPVLVAGTLRPDEPGVDVALLDAIAGGPFAEVVRPRSLSQAAAATLIERSLGSAPHADFARACHDACAGNPLLLREVARTAGERGLAGAAQDAEAVAALGSGGVADAVRRRLDALGPDAVAVARAAAVLGDREQLATLAALARRSTETTADAVDRLVRAEVLDAERWRFAHPLVRAAVAETLTPMERAGLHAHAAQLLAARGARADEVAVHLLATEPAGAAWIVDVLVEAADRAVREGAPETAMDHLRRALREPPELQRRAELLVWLGELEAAAGDDHAAEPLREALALGIEGDLAARAHVAHAAMLLLGADPAAAADALAAGLAAAEDPALAARLRSTLLEATRYVLPLRPQLRELLARFETELPDDPVVLMHRGYELVLDDPASGLGAELLARAASGGRLVRAAGPVAGVNLAVHAMRIAERPDLAWPLLDDAELEARRRGSMLGTAYTAQARAAVGWLFGSLTSAEASGRDALETVEATGLEFGRMAVTTMLAEILVERDQLEEASALAERFACDGPLAHTIAGPDALAARGWIRWLVHEAGGAGAGLGEAGGADANARGGGGADGDVRDAAERAEADLRRAYEINRAEHWKSPLHPRAGVRLVHVLAALGRRDEALALAEQEVARAQAAGLHGAHGVALRAFAAAQGGDAERATLEAAIAVLEPTPFALDRAWALHDLGAALRRAGADDDARDPLRIALDEAARLGATRLAERTRAELRATGARPRRASLAGPGSLTPAELRAAELAAKGLTNREIAETLWVTRKTVEAHLGAAYGKLGIRSRVQLAAALAGAAGG